MQLDPQQTLAAQTNSKNALVVAGPGSGKTRVIVERSAYLVEEGRISPYELLLLTFTRKAANEMRERLEDRIGRAAHKMTIGTFHSVALGLLHRFGELIGFRKENSTVYGDWETEFLLREVATELGIYKKKSWKVPKKAVVEAFETYYNTGREPSEDHEAYTLFMAFMQRCRENNSYTYGGLLTGLKLLLPKISQYLSWKHVITDESHDNDLLQWELVQEIQRLCRASLFCVADTDQAIYGFRGAVPEWLIDHQAEFNVFLLENNYRSAPGIVNGANRLIQHNVSRIDKAMVAAREDGAGGVSLLRDYDSARTAEICQAMNEEWGTEPSEIAILARNHVLLQKLSEELTYREIPHTYVGRKTKLTNSEEFRRFHAFLKLLVNPYDNFSFLLIRDLIGLTPQEYAEVRVRAATEGKSHFHAWKESGDDNNRWISFFDSATDWDLYSLAGNLESMFDPCLSVDTDHHPPFDFKPSLLFVWDWAAQHVHGTIQQYLDWLAVYDTQDEVEEKPDGVTLMTIHASKGLEFPVVILAGCNEGIIPSKQAMNSGEIEEERRLMYVAMTRACDQLILAVRPERKEAENGKSYENPRSRFLMEACGESMEGRETALAG